MNEQFFILCAVTIAFGTFLGEVIHDIVLIVVGMNPMFQKWLFKLGMKVAEDSLKEGEDDPE